MFEKQKRRLIQYLLEKVLGYQFVEAKRDSEKHFKLNNAARLAGFVAEYAAPNSIAKVLAQANLTSDDQDFYLYIDQIHSQYLPNIFPQSTHSFLIISHEDNTADVYINSLPLLAKARTKKRIEKDQTISASDIIGIKEVKMPGIEFNKRDNVIICFKVGWKFGLMFNLLQSHPSHSFNATLFLDQLAKLYNYLLFQKDLDVALNAKNFDELFQNGWFPFIQLTGGKYSRLADLFNDEEHRETLIYQFIDEYGKKQIEAFTAYWWSNEYFENKKDIILAGIEAFLEKTQRGNINAIKTLYSEIEGILRQAYHDEMHKKPTFKDLVDYLQRKADKIFSSDEILAFPSMFIKYLSDVFFKGFDYENNEVELSRHSSSHGVADSELYTRERAFQAILILDQIFFFMGKD